MKRTLIFILTALLLSSIASPALAAAPELAEVTGTISKVEPDANRILVTLADGSELVFNVDDKTTLLSAEDGSSINLNALSQGMTFIALHSKAMTRSLPPQTALHTMIAAASKEKDFAHPHDIGKVTVNSGMTEMLTKQGDVILRITDEIEVAALGQNGLVAATAKDIKAGSRIIAWYEVMALSYPGQAGPSKVLILAGGASPSNPPKSGSAASGALGVTIMMLGLACLAAFTVRSRQEY